MKAGDVAVEVLINPFCMAERDADIVRKLCRGLGVSVSVHNMWDIDDADLPHLPGHVATLVQELRTGRRAGSVYGSIFVNGERIPLNDWPHHMDAVEGRIRKAIGRQAP